MRIYLLGSILRAMHTTNPADFRSFYRSLDADAKRRFADAAGTTPKYIEVHLVYARRIPRPDKMEQLFAACQAFGAPFDLGQLIAFFYAESKALKTKTVDSVDEAAASDDTQGDAGGEAESRPKRASGSGRKTKQFPADARVA
ncbi:hypothetical protein QF001_000887 [Paraburkholderia youngii]|uniref:hypothetical protein n=1 Tax=Paraburkholderia youngii TaxID=2782701 RepID=UPI003D21B73C